MKDQTKRKLCSFREQELTTQCSNYYQGGKQGVNYTYWQEFTQINVGGGVIMWDIETYWDDID